MKNVNILLAFRTDLIGDLGLLQCDRDIDSSLLRLIFDHLSGRITLCILLRSDEGNIIKKRTALIVFLHGSVVQRFHVGVVIIFIGSRSDFPDDQLGVVRDLTCFRESCDDMYLRVVVFIFINDRFRLGFTFGFRLGLFSFGFHHFGRNLGRCLGRVGLDDFICRDRILAFRSGLCLLFRDRVLRIFTIRTMRIAIGDQAVRVVDVFCLGRFGLTGGLLGLFLSFLCSRSRALVFSSALFFLGRFFLLGIHGLCSGVRRRRIRRFTGILRRLFGCLSGCFFFRRDSGSFLFRGDSCGFRFLCLSCRFLFRGDSGSFRLLCLLSGSFLRGGLCGCICFRLNG